MPAFDPSEIRPGIVVRLDTDALRVAGGSLTNAQARGDEDRAVRGVHDFLIVAVDAAAGSCTAVPLFGKTAPGSSPLPAAQRGGAVGEWMREPAFYSHWQHWRIPVAAIAAASDGDPGSAGQRRTFGADDPDVRQDISNWAARNRNEFRPA